MIDFNGCCSALSPFSNFEQADVSYLGVGGFVNLESNREGRFEISFQRETSVGSGEVEDQIVVLEGCWLSSGEAASSGCSL